MHNSLVPPDEVEVLELSLRWLAVAAELGLPHLQRVIGDAGADRLRSALLDLDRTVIADWQDLSSAAGKLATALGVLTSFGAPPSSVLAAFERAACEPGAGELALEELQRRTSKWDVAVGRAHLARRIAERRARGRRSPSAPEPLGQAH